MKKIYELRLYDDCLMQFELDNKGLMGFEAKIINIEKDKIYLLPIDMSLNEEGVVDWLKKRIIPRNRAFVEEILKSMGLGYGDMKGIVDICKGLSLNDSYWVVPENFDGKFSEYNLYENKFSEILSLVAYTGIGQKDKGLRTTPELTTGGMLPKAWRIIEGKGIYLYKGGTSGAANTGNEPYSEYYACQVAEKMGLNVVMYDLEKWKGMLASTCNLFTDIDTAFIQIGRIVKEGGLEAVLNYNKELGDKFYQDVQGMLVLDAVIYNEDRHFGNFGILRDNKSGEILSTAPIFDNGLSLFNFAMDKDLDDIKEYAKTRTTPYYGVTYENIIKEVDKDLKNKLLRNLIGFKFKRHEKYNLDEKRLCIIEDHIQDRVKYLLSI